MPISFFSNKTKGDITDYSFGHTLDVSSCGICISARPNNIPDVSTMMTLLAIPEDQGRQSQSRISVTMQGKVMWNNIKKQNFGVWFIQPF
ncbi:MAG: hypothetical protein GY699_14530 [Desulfobacteraceae bacterium]|nr:hypothetical protein [Desulfobacteraceae bacterium]